MTRALRWMLWRRVEDAWVQYPPGNAVEPWYADPTFCPIVTEQPRSATRLFLYLKGRLER